MLKYLLPFLIITSTAVADSRYSSYDRVLTIEPIIIDGLQYGKAELQLNPDLTWELLTLDFNLPDDDVCLIDRKRVYSDITLYAANVFYPDTTMAWFETNKELKAYDDICALRRNAYIDYALKEQSRLYYPRFDQIKRVLNDYFGIFE